MVLIEAAAYMVTRGLILWGTSVFSMELMQFVYAIATSTELGYFAYVYVSSLALCLPIAFSFDRLAFTLVAIFIHWFMHSFKQSYVCALSQCGIIV